jgi:serine/threonine protein kinase
MPALESGRRIGNYVVREILGQGGMGAVYLATHAIIGRQVAIKVLRRELAHDAGQVARFLNEARAAALARHPGIVEVFDVGSLPSGVPYLVMEYLCGESLAQRLLRTGRLEIDQAAAITQQVASALAAAHQIGIVHRDLKPANLFLTFGREQPEMISCKVLDFGIAKLQSATTAVSTTQSGALLGTPLYMSPEQARGVRAGIDHRTDIYSLGAILYQMVCGTPPFVGDGWGDLLLRHMTEEPVRPSQHNPAVSPAGQTKRRPFCLHGRP